MKHWHIDEIAWDSFDPSRVDPEIVPLVKAAAMVERNAADYVTYLTRVFQDDPDFKAAAEHWGVEETQHGDALGRWGELADPGWNFQAAFARYRAGYQVQLDANASIRGSRSGELIAGGVDNGFDGLYEGYELVQPQNIGDAEYKGLEFEVRQRMTFLPGALRGLTLRANYTYLKAKGRFGGATQFNNGQIAGF